MPLALPMVADVSLWLRWNFDPILVLGIALLVAAYFYALNPLRRRYGWADHVDARQTTAFAAAVVVLTLALVSPLDTLGDDYLFSMHMVQHMLIAVVFPPLLLLGTPEWMVTPLFRAPALRRAARWIALPAVAFTIFNADLWLWHAPALYDATLSNDTLHIFEHLTFIIFGVVYWLPICGPRRIFPRVGGGTGVLYLFLGCQPMVVLGALLTFAPQPFYLPYLSDPRLWGLSPVADQQLGGLIMWFPTNIPYFIGLSVLFFRWVSERDHAERAAAGEFDDPAALTAPVLSPVEHSAETHGAGV